VPHEIVDLKLCREAVVVTADSRDPRAEQAEIKEMLRELEPLLATQDLAVSKEPVNARR